MRQDDNRKKDRIGLSIWLNEQLYAPDTTLLSIYHTRYVPTTTVARAWRPWRNRCPRTCSNRSVWIQPWPRRSQCHPHTYRADIDFLATISWPKQQDQAGNVERDCQLWREVPHPLRIYFPFVAANRKNQLNSISIRPHPGTAIFRVLLVRNNVLQFSSPKYRSEFNLFFLSSQKWVTM